jgi:3-isopropylmalate/(R)-2-methylmalate dehydratase small subunit
VNVEGKHLPLDRSNVDTDQIIPTKYLGAVEKAGLGAYALSGVPGIEPLYAQYPDASIIVARENFGAGSSREHAVWALQSRGFKAVIAPSFARIFEENAYNNGFVLAAVPGEEFEAVLRAPSSSIDVAAERLTLPDGTQVSFKLDPLRKEFILGGGFLAYLAGQVEAIRTWEKARP